MIKLLDIKSGLVKLLNRHFKDYEVHFDNVEKSNEPYFYVEMRPRHTTFDDVITEKSIAVDIQLVLKPNKNGRVKRSLLYDVIDTLDSVIRPVLQIQDRFITILKTNATIHDDILHFEFYLDFADNCFTDAEAGGIIRELMQELEIKIN